MLFGWKYFDRTLSDVHADMQQILVMVVYMHQDATKTTESQGNRYHFMLQQQQQQPM